MSLLSDGPPGLLDPEQLIIGNREETWWPPPKIRRNSWMYDSGCCNSLVVLAFAGVSELRVRCPISQPQLYLRASFARSHGELERYWREPLSWMTVVLGSVRDTGIR